MLRAVFGPHARFVPPEVATQHVGVVCVARDEIVPRQGNQLLVNSGLRSEVGCQCWSIGVGDLEVRKSVLVNRSMRHGSQLLVNSGVTNELSCR